ncbi:hypothetical protein [Kineococcus radiotolerans]|uniref:Uncharacterized protein n=1 Tax=Kineococcus radiotolerans (strain ATCC BAA-149 / DSM 14245 / SRS30216) TaxID=266940 RepID=A6W8Q1_KINRD|nr:hypothetical protein [Kineococcus radiotolerans]ABS03190.1 hypothetical protein Krad_1704 [Kineococcus radiotolerans SRS30216 = ATCC BAA-149]
MAFPNELSVARLRANWLKFNGDPSPAILSISARYFTGIGDTLITDAPVEVRLQNGRLDIPVPVGDDPDLSRPLQLDIVARINGSPRPKTWTVTVTNDDVETITENGQQLRIVNLNKLLEVDGLPIITLGFVRTVTVGSTAYKPDARGNVILPAFLNQAALADALQGYAKTTDLQSHPTRDQVDDSIDAALTEYTKTAALQRLIRNEIAQMVVAGPGIQVAYDPQAGLLIITNTGGGSTPEAPAGSLQSTFTSTL